MASQTEHARTFTSLHVKGDPLIIFNVWDAGTAKAVAEAGAKAVATGSWAVAAANGYEDGENVPLDLVIENLKRVVNAVDLPVSLDLEGGYAVGADDLRKNVDRVIEAGAVGVNFEDRVVPGRGLYSIEEQSTRIRAIRDAADKRQVPFYINARSDVALSMPAAEHGTEHVDELIKRAKAYADAGASGFFAPGLINAEFIRALCDASPLPVNILVMPGVPSSKELADLGVARISYGSGSYRTVMEAFRTAARAALSGD